MLQAAARTAMAKMRNSLLMACKVSSVIVVLHSPRIAA
jgi:hypothetical protein